MVITGGIDKAYLQINVDEKDRDLLRFLRLKNLLNKHEVELCKYQFNRAIFGANCSQFLLNPTIENILANIEFQTLNLLKRYEINFKFTISIPVLIL